jgi:hypothetical protein
VPSILLVKHVLLKLKRHPHYCTTQNVTTCTDALILSTVGCQQCNNLLPSAQHPASCNCQQWCPTCPINRAVCLREMATRPDCARVSGKSRVSSTMACMQNATEVLAICQIMDSTVNWLKCLVACACPSHLNMAVQDDVRQHTSRCRCRCAAPDEGGCCA